jgi:opacity protein-like surface antigen
MNPIILMTKPLILLCASSLLTGTAAFAQDYVDYGNTSGGGGQHSGISLGIQGGAIFLQDISDFGTDISFDTGFGGTVPLGIHFGNGFSLEASVGYYTADVEEISIGNLGNLTAGSDLTLIPMMASGMVRLPASDNLNFYLGGGFGVIYSEVNLKSIEDLDISTSEDDFDFGVQARAGLSFGLGSAIDLDIGYRYLQMFSTGEDTRGHAVEAGLTIKF